MSSLDSDDDNMLSSRRNAEFKSSSEKLQIKNKVRREKTEAIKHARFVKRINK